MIKTTFFSLVFFLFIFGCSSTALEDAVYQGDLEARDTYIREIKLAQNLVGASEPKEIVKDFNGRYSLYYDEASYLAGASTIFLEGVANDNGGIARVEIFLDGVSVATPLGKSYWDAGEITVTHNAAQKHEICMEVTSNIGIQKRSCFILQRPLEQLDNYPLSVASGGCHVYNNKIYSFGGIPGLLPTDKLYIDDLVTNPVWVDSNKLMTGGGRHSFASVLYNGKIYVFGGIKSQDQDDPGLLNYPTDILIYDIAGNSWTSVTGGATLQRFGYSAVEVNGLIYLIGGQYTDDVDVKTVEVFNPADDSITTLPLENDMTEARIGFGAVADGNYINVLSGYNLTDLYLSTVQRFDTVSKTWENRPSLPNGVIPRTGFASGMINGYYYLFAGGTIASAYSVINRYDLANNSWDSVEADLNYTYRGGMSCSDGNSIYLIGGRDNVGLPSNKVFRYTPLIP